MMTKYVEDLTGTHGRRITPRADLAEDPGALLDMRIWLAQHQLPDVYDLPVTSDIYCDDDARTVTVRRFSVNKEGKRFVGEERNALACEWVTVQLEAPALEPPEGCCVVFRYFPHEHEPQVDITALNYSRRRYICKHCHDAYWGEAV